MAIGRPKKVRVPGTGEKLRAALRLVGLTWSSSDYSAVTHVLNNKRWAKCGLPRSINTLINDIKFGIPIERLGSYSSFFSVSPDVFLNDIKEPCFSDFSCEIIKNKHKIFIINPPSLHSEDPSFCQLLACYNDENSMDILEKILHGLYLIYIRESSTSKILTSVVNVHTRDHNNFLASGYLKHYGVDIYTKCRIFRWSTFLHINYLSTDYHVLGYMMACDPTTSLLSARRAPLQIPLFGLAGSIVSPTVPDRFYGYAEKITVPGGTTVSDLYDKLCEQIKRIPYIDSTDEKYSLICSSIDVIQNEPQNYFIS